MSNAGSTDKHLGLAVVIANEGLKALLVINGGAAAALIALTDKGGTQDYSTAILAFGAGAAASVTAYFFAYLSQLNYANFLANGMNYWRHLTFQTCAYICVLIALGFLFSGLKSGYSVARWPSTGNKATYQLPTVADAFALRSKCTELGDKLLDADVHGPALFVQQVPRYDTKTNRCYVELQASTADLSAPHRSIRRTLYDGQTREILAWYSQQYKGDKSETTCASFQDKLLSVPFKRTCDDINDKLNDFMFDERTQ